MDIKGARYVLAVSKYKSINKAAKKLYISQPSLSKYLQNLEYRMGVKLFSHISNEYVPTYAGERYLSYAKKMVALENDWNEELKDMKQLKKGKLNIAIPTVRSAYLIPDTVSVFHKEFPDIEINIYEKASFVEKALELEDKVDVAIYNVNRCPTDLDYQVIGRSEIVLVVHKDHPVVKKAISKKGLRHQWVDFHDLLKEPLILLDSEQTTGKAVERLFVKNGITPNVWMRTRSSEVAIRMALKKTGMTFVADGYVEHLGLDDSLVSLSVGEEQIYTTMIAAYRRGQYIPTYLQRYIEIVKQVLFGQSDHIEKESQDNLWKNI